MGPLTGLRILDFTWFAAGPSGTLQLAFAGAEVIRVESRVRLDGYRRETSVEDDVDRFELFAGVNSSKKSITINLKNPAGLELLYALAKHCDVVVESFTPGTADRLGIGFKNLSVHRQDLVMISASAAGQIGPRSHHAGYASTFSAMGGLAAVTGHPTGRPYLYGRGLDARVGSFVALAVVTGVLLGRRTGAAVHLDLSDQEVVATLIGDLLFDASTSSSSPGRQGSYIEGLGGSRCYRCDRDDEWLMLEIRDDADWHRLCKEMGRPELEAEFGDGPTRWNAREKVEEIIERWLRTQSRSEAVSRLQASGLSACPVARIGDLNSDQHLRSREFWKEVDHPTAGRMSVVGSAIRWRDHTNTDEPIRPAPLLGQNTDEVLTGLLSLSPDEVQLLRSRGALD